MRIAFFTILSPIRSALADCAEGLILAMAKNQDVIIDIFINDDYQPDNNQILKQFNIYTYHKFAALADQYQSILYWMGDHGQYHGFMLDFIHRFPGIVVLNDLTLHRCIMQNTLDKGDPATYQFELQYAYGNVNAIDIATQIKKGQDDQIILKYPLYERVVDSSLGVIVHSEYGRNKILASHPQSSVKRIPYPFFMPGQELPGSLAEARAQARTSLDLSNDTFVVGSSGIFVPNKHLGDSFSAFAHILPKHPRSKYILSGFAVPEYNLASHIEQMGLTPYVTLTGWLPPDEFSRQMAAFDVGIHLRYPHIGGVPYTPIRLMGLGVCTIISDIEPLAEFPQGACIKIPPDAYQRDSLRAILEYLADHPDFRQQIARNGQRFIEQNHDIDRIAEQYLQFLMAHRR